MANFLKNIHPLLRRSKRQNEYDDSNFSVLNALNYELTQAEKETIESKIHSSLETATGEYLDAWGDWFGYYRKDGWDDEYYRKRIIRYLLLKRGTIPAIIDAILDFLDDYDATVDIYEPWKNIFYTNKSKLNGEDHMMGYYYRFAIIDISIDRPFPETIVEVVKAFKPAGVLFYLRYDPSIGRNATESFHPVADMTVTNKVDAEISNGSTVSYRGNVNLQDSRQDVEFNNIFYTNKSHLNSKDVLAGSFSHGRDRLHLGSVTTKYVPKKNLLSNTSFATTTGWYPSHSGTLAITTDYPAFPGEIPVKNVFKITQRAGQNWGYLTQYTQNVSKPTTVGKQYTVSAWVYAPSSIPSENYRIGKFDSVSGVGWSNGRDACVDIRDKWAYVSYTFTATHVNTVVVVGIASVGAVNYGYHYVAGVKLEEGTGTGFSLAPEDDAITDYEPKQADTLADVKLAIGETNEDLYIQTKDLDDRSANVVVAERTDTKAYAVFNVKDYVQTYYSEQLRQLTNNMSEVAALDLIFNEFTISTGIRALASPTDKLTGKMQIYDFASNEWFDLAELALDLNQQILHTQLNKVSAYINDNGLMFIRYTYNFKEDKDIIVELDMLNVVFNYEQGGGNSIAIQADVVSEVEVLANAVTLNKSSIDLAINETATLVATILPESTTYKKVVWESTKPEIATVDSTGKMVGVTAGKAEVVAYNESREVSARCTVSVYKPATEIQADPAEVNITL